MAVWQFFLLGAPRLEQQHQNVNLSRRKTIAALAYLAVTRQPHSRDTLATLLWPDQDQSGARANLRRDLSTLRQILGDQTLLVEQSLVSLDPDADLWVDVDAFQGKLAEAQRHSHPSGRLCAECAAAVKDAVDLYNGDFMAGFSLPDSPEFDEWQFFETERLRHLFAEALQRLIGWHTDRAEYEPAIACARRWLALDALHEPAHRQLMQLYAWTGQHAAALRQYQECARLLEEELGAPPDAETTALYEAIRTKQLLPPTLEPKPDSLVAEPEPRERYQTERLLEVGGYGEVYLGCDTVTGRAVVIKRLKPELVAQDPAFVTRFAREAQALRQLDHPNIVAILATIEQDGEHRIVMEYAPGGTLRDLLEKEGPLSWERGLSIALELADALSRAHHLNIIHRDLKPDNVLLAADGTPRLTDFGMARLQIDDVRLTQPGMIVGSPAYLSPEALRGEELDPRSDIWSFGVLLYELLAGRPPFEGQQLISVLSNILHAPTPDITQARSDVPPPLADLLQRMLAKDREERIASMRMVAAELEAIRAGRPFRRSTPSRSPARPDVRHEQQIRFCTAPDEVRIAYGQMGVGPLLIKAGNPLNHLEYDLQSPIWRHWWTGLAEHYTFVRYDERGCGLSDRNVADYSMDAWVGDLEAVVDQLNAPRFTLLGVSQGASVAIAYAVRHPERVSHLILYGGYSRGRFNRNPTPEQLEEARTLIHIIRVGWGQDNTAFRQVFAKLFMPDGKPEQIEKFAELARISTSAENAALMEMAFFNINVAHLAPQVRVPTLVLHARGDAMCPFDEGRYMASLIPGARFVSLESNNHILLEYEPAWLQFLSEVTEFTKTEQRKPTATIPPAMEVLAPPTPTASQREWEQNIGFCQSSDGARLAYATVGNGPPLVKAANWLSHLEYDWQSPIWRHWLIGLAQQHTLIRYDERGCGLSDWQVADISFEAWVRDLEAVVDAAGVERFPLIGISKGGSIAIAYAARHPERVSHLILYGAYARGRLIRNVEPQQAEEAELLTNLIRIGWGRENPAFRQVFASTFMPDGTQEQHRWFNELQRVSASPENAARIYAGSNLTDVRDLAAQLRVPTLVLHARGDARVPFEEGRLLASLIPGARLVTLDSNNHLLLEHEPAWQKFLSEVHEFLAAMPERLSRWRAMPAQAQPEILPSGVPDRSLAQHNLRPQTTSFVGRGQELDEIRSLLIDDPACRLLTLSGLGGSGKTRLAMAAAHDVSDFFQHGAWFVSLVAVSSPELIVYTIAETLGVKIAGPRPASAQLNDYLRDKQMLLVLDNFEHILAGAGVINDLLEAAPDLKILSTSRERLNVQAEHVIRLAGLPFPLSENDDARGYDAVKLFVRRALSVRSDFAVDEASLKVVARICQLVEGLPLALELAARWLQVLSLEEIVAEIAKGLDVLATDTRDVPERHRSLRAVIDYSWSLLSAEEQRVLRRLSVFRGGFRRDAAAEVAGASLPILASLADKSLLNMTAEGRYRRHPLIYQYTQEKLAEQVDELHQAQAAHATTYLRFLQKWGQELRGGRQKEALQVIEEELDNIHTALHWAVAEQQIDLLRESWDTIDEFYLQRQRLPEGIEVFAHIVKDLDEANPAHFPVLGRALVVQAHFHFRLDRYEESRQLAERGLQLLQTAGDARGSMKGLNILGLTALSTGDYTVARANLQQALTMAEAYHETGLRANYLNNLAILEATSGNYAAAERYYREALALNEQRGNHLSRVRNLANLGELLYTQNRWREAEEVLQEGLTLSREMGFAQTTRSVLTSLAGIAVARKEYDKARALYHEVLLIARDRSARANEGEAAQGLGRVALAQGDFATAQQYFQLALQIAADTQSTRLMLEALADIAAFLARVGRKIQAVELFTLLKQHPASPWQTKETARQRLAELGTVLPSDQVAAATTRGQAQDVQSIAQRLSEELSDPKWLVTSKQAQRLPTQATPFIGREKELAEIQGLIGDDPACRLLTLVGPGGIGKTRLAIQAAARSDDVFQDGAALVALASVGTADLILPALAEALDYKLSGTAAPKDQLLNYLRDKQLLLIFDNFEHVLAGVELLSEILADAPHTKIVATSRERLNVQEEWVYEVAGMAFPRAGELPLDDGALVLEKYSAVQLFVQRARQVVVSFAPTPADITAIAQICELVEGSPLAIELAAAWVNVLDCAAIAAEVQRGQEILTTQQRDIPEHHRSMQVVFNRTWTRLTDDERSVFTRLSVFRGGFRRTAAQDVAEASLAILAALVNKSLLRRDQTGHYQVHELLRQYAAGQLARSESGEQRTHDRHCRYYGALLQDSFDHILDGRQLEVARRIEAEFGNIHAAWSWAIAHQRAEFVQQAVGPLWSFYEYRSRYAEGADMLNQALEFLIEQPSTEAIEHSRMLTQVSLAWLHIRLGHLADAEKRLHETLATYERLGLPPVVGVATDPRVALGILASIRGDYVAMIQLGEEAVRLSEQHDHRWNRPFAYYLLTRAALAQGDYEQAQRYAQQASTAAQESKDRWFLAYCLVELGNVALAQDQFAIAKEHYQASFVIRQEFADREGMALALNRLATATYRQQAFAEARSLYLHSLDLYRELNDKGGLASTLNGLAFVASGQADYETAAQHFRQALQITRDLQFAPLELWVLLGVGEMLLSTHQIERGVELLQLVEQHPAAEREARQRARGCLDRFRDQLPPGALAAIHPRGQQLDLDNVAGQLLTDLLARPSDIVKQRSAD
jgi:predicted ATPase/serine/threonine protein kinase/DNA-binding SARP family transcriptional activator/alpha-beta hydrolase superfamily lysophospholipase